MKQKPTYALVIEDERPEGELPPVEVRLRLVLKRILRAYGFRCVEAKEVVMQEVPGAVEGRAGRISEA